MKIDGIMRLILIGIITKLREVNAMTYRVPMKLLSDAYADDYVEYMVMEKEIDKVIKEIEKAVDDNDAQGD